MIEGFKYHGTNKAYFSNYVDGKWQEGKLEDSININISALSAALQYGQSIFEGLKAYRAKDGRVLLFRPDMNYKRLLESSKRLLIPEMTYEMFLEAVVMVCNANRDLIPSYESKGALYLRPFIIGTESVLGVRGSTEFLFSIVATPVGSYFKDGFAPIKLITSDYDRAAPNGLGNIKVGANYASSLYPKMLAKKAGFDDCLYLDPKTHTKLDESGASNVILIKGNTFITPQSSSILPSITNNSLQILAKDYLKMEVIIKDVLLKDLVEYDEFGACGTAAVITPVNYVRDKDTEYHFKSYEKLQKLYNLLQSIQYGDEIVEYAWVFEI